MEKTIEIPEGYEARIEGNKVILESKLSEDERMIKAIHIYLDWLKGRKNYEPKGEYSLEDMISWIEKQGSQNLANSAKTCKDEQKTADKVEAKRNSDIEKGKWYVCDTPRYADFGVGKAYYCPKNGMLKPNENEMARYVAKDCFHLWTIDDAKDGDVLAEHETIVLFKKIEGLNIRCYCTYHYLGYNPTFYVDTLQNKTSYRPATKEQRDLLFQKMKEAGYEWDSEKKELKEIEQNHAWSEDEKPLLGKFKQAVYDCAWGKVTCKAEGETKEEYANRWAEHFLLMVRDWADDYIDYAIQQKLRKSYDKGKEDAIKTNSPAWSEEDEHRITDTIYFLETAKKHYASTEELDACIEYLKSIKERVPIELRSVPSEHYSEEDDIDMES